MAEAWLPLSFDCLGYKYVVINLGIAGSPWTPSAVQLIDGLDAVNSITITFPIKGKVMTVDDV